MPAPCGCCVSPQRDAIDAACADGQTITAIASRFGVTTNNAKYHRRAHLDIVMRPLCPCCTSPHREYIEGTASDKEIAARFGLTINNVQYHRRSHASAPADRRPRGCEVCRSPLLQLVDDMVHQRTHDAAIQAATALHLASIVKHRRQCLGERRPSHTCPVCASSSLRMVDSMLRQGLTDALVGEVALLPARSVGHHRRKHLQIKLPTSGKCSVCLHPDHVSIDLLLFQSSQRNLIALRYLITTDALSRHARRCLGLPATDRWRGMQCGICHSESREEIDEALGREAVSVVAALYEINGNVLRNHKQRHTSETFRVKEAAFEVCRLDALRDYVQKRDANAG